MLIRALALERAAVVSLCGAGGKTSLMFALAKEFVAAGERVLITTTTKIAREEAEGSWPSFAAAGADEVLEVARRLMPDDGRAAGAVIAYSAPGPGGKRLVGFAPELVDSLARSTRFDRILVEADGSQRKPLKAPAAHEPVIPSQTDALIIVAGLNGLGLPLDDQHLFRPERWAQLSGIEPGSPVTAESLARIVVHPDGLARGCPSRTRRMLFLNRADSPDRQAAAKQVIDFLVGTPARTLERAVAGCLLPAPNVVDVAAFR